MRLRIITPHFAPDVAPTGVVVTRIVEELGRRGHRLDVFTSYPWYRQHRIEKGYEGRLIRHQSVSWGTITRVHPFPTQNKKSIARRALAFGGFSALTAIAGRRGKADAVLSLSPPLTLGLTGASIARSLRAPFVFNIQDVFPDVAIELDVLRNKGLIAATRRLERRCYRRADAITVLSEDIRTNLAERVDVPAKLRVIPNFVDTDVIRPLPKENPYRAEHGLQGKCVVMYAGNVGLSQAFDPVLKAAAALATEEDVVFVINGHGAERSSLQRQAAGLRNVVFVDMQPPERLPEVLGAADIHLVPLKKGLARASVPSKTYSILAAARPLVASVDPGSEVARVVEAAGAGIALSPGDPEGFTKAIRRLFEAPAEAEAMGAAGRRWVERWASPAAVAESYEVLFEEVVAAHRRS